jgi:hypothetical protein
MNAYRESNPAKFREYQQALQSAGFDLSQPLVAQYNRLYPPSAGKVLQGQYGAAMAKMKLQDFANEWNPEQIKAGGSGGFTFKQGFRSASERRGITGDPLRNLQGGALAPRTLVSGLGARPRGYACNLAASGIGYDASAKSEVGGRLLPRRRVYGTKQKRGGAIQGLMSGFHCADQAPEDINFLSRRGMGRNKTHPSLYQAGGARALDNQATWETMYERGRNPSIQFSAPIRNAFNAGSAAGFRDAWQSNVYGAPAAVARRARNPRATGAGARRGSRATLAPTATGEFEGFEGEGL